MKWLNELTSTSVFTSTESVVTTSSNRWMVAEIGEDKTLCLMKEDVAACDILEGIVVEEAEMLERIEESFEEVGYACVRLNSEQTKCIEFLPPEGEG